MNIIKDILRKVTFRLIKNDVIWLGLDLTIIRFARYASSHRHVYDVMTAQYQAAKLQFPDQVVRNGIFKGLRYPGLRAYGSVLYPKLLGCYEIELEPLLRKILITPYSEIIDIGCAEGYYAVGLALCRPHATVYAFDAEEDARYLCREMAIANGVSKRVHIGGLFRAGTLSDIKLGSRSLIICDCEGCEKELFTTETIHLLKHTDLLIEVHEHLKPGTSELLQQVFRSTHDLSLIQGLDDAKRISLCRYPELEIYSSAIKEKLLTELRPVPMQWFFFQANL